jgi:transcriptional regulator with XRE-family HTH domain
METKTWSEKVGSLQASGMTYAEIAEATGSKLSTIGSIATGAAKSPRGDLALRLHTLFLQRANQSKTKAA